MANRKQFRIPTRAVSLICFERNLYFSSNFIAKNSVFWHVSRFFGCCRYFLSINFHRSTMFIFSWKIWHCWKAKSLFFVGRSTLNKKVWLPSWFQYLSSWFLQELKYANFESNMFLLPHSLCNPHTVLSKTAIRI